MPVGLTNMGVLPCHLGLFIELLSGSGAFCLRSAGRAANFFRFPGRDRAKMLTLIRRPPRRQHAQPSALPRRGMLAAGLLPSRAIGQGVHSGREPR